MYTQSASQPSQSDHYHFQLVKRAANFQREERERKKERGRQRIISSFEILWFGWMVSSVRVQRDMCPTEYLIILEPQSPPIDVSGEHKARWSGSKNCEKFGRGVKHGKDLKSRKNSLTVTAGVTNILFFVTLRIPLQKRLESRKSV